MADGSFQVDLRGVIDLFSRHLYSSPRVFARELVQNAVDAIRARETGTAGHARPERPGVLLVPSDLAGDGRLHCLDQGIGLTADEMGRFLATIGASSKRDDLGLARGDFLGQFGIGLLSCFLVSDEIEVVSRSATGGPAVRWVGLSIGSFRITELSAEQERELARQRRELPGVAAALPETGPDGGQGGGPDLDRLPVGSWVRLRPGPGQAEWTTEAMLTGLLTDYCRMLPVPILVGTAAKGPLEVSGGPLPWAPAPGAMGLEVARHETEQLLGVRSLAALPVSVPEADLRGMALILGQPTAPSARQAHRVYARGMLVGAAVPGLLPEWAFFARCVADSGQLRLTASREALYDDDLLDAVRTSLSEQLRRWMLRMAAVDEVTFGRFLELHAVAVKGQAVHDDELRAAVLPWLSFETSAGRMTLPEVRQRFGAVRYVSSVDDFRQVAPVAAAQGLGVVNAGYVHDAELVERAQPGPGEPANQLIVPGDLAALIGPAPEADAARLRPFVAAARRVLAEVGVDVDLRSFAPSSLPGLVLDDREARYRRSSRAAQREEGVWGLALADLDDGRSDRPMLLLNVQSPVVRRVADVTGPDLLRLAVQSLYCQALLLGRHPLRPEDTTLLDRSFLGLLEHALAPTAEEPAPRPQEDDR